MPIDRDNKLVFIHIPKNAGTTIERVIGTWDFKRTDKSRDARKANLAGMISYPHKFRHGLWRERSWQHITALQARKVLGPGRYKNYFSFAVVRNPWDRMVSWYHYLGVKRDFAQWVLSPDPGWSHITREVLLRPQTDYLTDRSGRIIVDKVIHFKQLYSGLRSIDSNLFGQIEHQPRERNSKRGPYRTYYSTPESISAVEKMFAEDISRFKFAF